MILSTQSPYTFVWHENGGQSTPANDAKIQSITNEQGFILDIADNAEIQEPVIIISSAGKTSRAKNVINVGKAANVTIIEYMMSDDNETKNHMSSTINCADSSQIKHCILQHAQADKEIEQSAHVTITQQQYSQIDTNVFCFGGRLNQVMLNVALKGADAKCNASNLAYTHGEEKQNVSFNIEHYHPQCTSSSLARGVIKDKSSLDFNGKITVHKNACKSLADLQIKNLLCSTKAQANNKPELEIYNDDVKCSHGSSTGQLDQNALFYMRSRGIDLETATEMLIAGFIQPVIRTCKIPSIVEYVQHMVTSRT